MYSDGSRLKFTLPNKYYELLNIITIQIDKTLLKQPGGVLLLY